MKKFLSIALAAMMLVSLFAVNVGAAPVVKNKTVTVYDYALNDFSSDTTFKTGASDKAIITYPEVSGNKVLSAEFVSLNYGMYAEIEKGSVYTIEFDVMPKNQSQPLGVGIATNDNQICRDFSVQIPAFAMENDVWYTYRIAIDESGITADTTPGVKNVVTKVERKKKSEAEFSESSYATTSNYLNSGKDGTLATAPTYQNTYRPIVDFSKASAVPAGIEAIGFAGGNPNYKATQVDETKYPIPTGNAVYYIDNLKVYHTEEVVDGIVDTIYAEQDYEDLANNDEASLGTAVENGNTYGILSGHSTVTVGPDLGFDSYDDVELTFDLRAMAPGAFGIFFQLTASPVETALPFVRTDEGMELEKWYRYKVIVDLDDEGNKVPTIVRKNLTDGGDWVELAPSTPINNGTGDDTKYEFGMNSVVGNGQNSAIKFGTQRRGEQQPEGAVTTACVWHLDNIKVTSREFIKVSDVNATATTAAATVEFSKGGLYDAGTQYTVMMASYEGGVLADVAFEVVTAVAGAVADVDLSVDITDDVRIYVWDANNTPVLTNVFDLSDYL